MVDERPAAAGGGPPSTASFPSTRWTLLLAAKDPSAPAWREALGALCRSYWRPVFHYICAGWGRSAEDARDLTQEFFLRLLDGDALAAVSPDKGRFRHFVKAALRHFLLKMKRDARRQKRGGGAAVLSLDAVDWSPPAPGLTPEEALDRAWAAAVLEDAGRRLREVLTRDGKATAYEVFRLCHLAPEGDAPPAHDEVARRLGIGRFDVGNQLKAARREYRRLVLETLRDSVADEDEARRELLELFEGDAS